MYLFVRIMKQRITILKHKRVVWDFYFSAKPVLYTLWRKNTIDELWFMEMGYSTKAQELYTWYTQYATFSHFRNPPLLSQTTL